MDVVLIVGASVVLLIAVGVLQATATRSIAARIHTLDLNLERIERSTRDEFTANRRESADGLQRLSDSLVKAQSALGDAQAHQLQTFGSQLGDHTRTQNTAIDALRSTLDAKVDTLRTAVEHQLREIQKDNAAKLEQMRQTVDEKLQSTLETRLGESFRQVSDRLEQVYRGLGEMQVLATGVGDLKRVLSNVKARGTWGEVQLSALLEQVLSSEQYASNVPTGEGGERVEYAIKLPGRNGKDDNPAWLPIDAKFPLEDYQSLTEAADRADAQAMEEAGRRLEARVKASAKDIASKYINPPNTTDFAILFLPNEGLYAEVLRRPGLADCLQRDHRIVLAGPTTLWAILTSLQMGFRTLAIERRSSEVWALLGAVKTEFGKFGMVLDRVQKNLESATSKIDKARQGTRAIARKLADVQELPANEAVALLEGGVIEVETGPELVTG